MIDLLINCAPHNGGALRLPSPFMVSTGTLNGLRPMSHDWHVSCLQDRHNLQDVGSNGNETYNYAANLFPNRDKLSGPAS